MRLAPNRMLRTSAAVLLPLLSAPIACDDRAETTASPEAPLPQHSAIAAENHVQFAQLRQVTARFHNFEAAVAAGYEVQVTPCWTSSSAGAMGYHYGDLDLFDATVDLLAPEVLMYEPQAGGHLRLVGMEYIVPLAAWEAAGHDLNDPSDVPELLGRPYTRHSFLPIFKLHIWLWRDNPSGTFADWNPMVSCAHAEHTEVF